MATLVSLWNTKFGNSDPEKDSSITNTTVNTTARDGADVIGLGGEASHFTSFDSDNEYSASSPSKVVEAWLYVENESGIGGNATTQDMGLTDYPGQLGADPRDAGPSEARTAFETYLAGVVANTADVATARTNDNLSESAQRGAAAHKVVRGKYRTMVSSEMTLFEASSLAAATDMVDNELKSVQFD